MKRFLKLSIILIFISSILPYCKKRSDVLPGLPVGDEIIYTDISPDTSFTSVRTWKNEIGQDIPVPADSSAGMLLDIDKDKISDMGVGISTSYNFVSASNPAANYNFYSGIYMINNSAGIAYSGTSGSCKVAHSFSNDSVISNKSTYTNSVATFCQGASIGCDCNSFAGDTYFGFRLWNNGVYNYGWILLHFDYSMTITVKEFAINKTVNKSIRAGQKY